MGVMPSAVYGEYLLSGDLEPRGDVVFCTGSLDSGEPKCLGAAVRTFGDQVPE